MTLRRRTIIKLFLAGLILSISTLGCSAVPERPTVFPAITSTLQMEPGTAVWTRTTPTKQLIARPTRTKTILPSASFTSTAMEQTSTKSIVLPGFVPQGARARLGRGTVNRIAVSPDGKTFVVAAATGLFFYDLATFQAIRSIPTNIAMTDVSFSSDGSTLASLSKRVTPITTTSSRVNYDSIYIWDAMSGQLRQEISISETCADHLEIAFSPDGKTLAVGQGQTSSRPGAVDIWDLASGKLQRTVQDEEILSADSMAFSSDGKILAVGFWHGNIVLWNDGTGELINKIKDIASGLDILALSPNGGLLAVGKGNSVNILDTTGAIRFQGLEGLSGKITVLLFSPDGKELMAGDTQGNVVQWDSNSGHPIHAINKFGEAVRALAFSPNGKTLMAGLAGSIHVWNSIDGQSLRTINYPFSKWMDARYSSDGSELGLHMDGKVEWVNPSTSSELASSNIPTDTVLSPDYQMYAYASAQKTIIIADSRNGKTIFSLDRPVYLDNH